MFKKIAILLAAATLSAPAFADRGYRGHDHHYYKKHRPVVHHYHYYRPAPPAVVHHYHRPAPQPVVVVHRHEPVLPILVGAVIGAAIVHHAVTYY
jgi:hypothetical protein